MAQDLAGTVREQLSGMGRAERQRAIESLRSVMLDAMYQTERESAGYEVKCCPRCGCVEIVRKGHAKDGSQRYLCHGCGRTFGVRTGRVVGMSKLPAEKWMAYIQCFADRLSLRACAERVGVSLPTSLFMRRRLLEVAATFAGTFSVAEGCGCELDETYFPESFKGNHRRGSFELPRRAHHRGRQRRKRGLSKEQICIMSGVNDSGESFLDMAGRGSLSSQRARLPARQDSGRRSRGHGQVRRVPVRSEGAFRCGAPRLWLQGPLRGDHQPRERAPLRP